ncbi:unnamed protein product [Medioppia subpectinata]|uniref:G-protein coupled receptors family 1 profile domain-containing protein n=1 Tax=Medioppia subpectinata TaxID=1979941 RepID=A0A7R9KRJ2_9ACAR|nr:unnamed protein product [Medioppia subpectinata]CAG2108210.1 unnamed protein product [Medioppia subpectinata]
MIIHYNEMNNQLNITTEALAESQGTAANNFIITVTFGCCCLSSLLAIFGNSMIIWIVGCARSMRTPTNVFIANLALSDILIGTLVIPFQFQISLLKRWLLPDFMCYLCPTIQTITVSNSVYTLTAIAIERYRAVKYPLLAHVSKLNAKILCKVQLIRDELTDTKTLPHCQNTILMTALFGTYSSALVFIQYFIPLCVISYTYLRMALVLSAPQEEIIQTVRVNNINIKRKNKKNSKKFK